MKKVLILMALIVILCGKAYAEDVAGKINFGANWFYYSSNDAEFEGDNIKNEGTPTAFNVHASYCLPKPAKPVNISLGLDFEHVSRQIIADENMGQFSNDLGTLDMNIIMAVAHIKYTDFKTIIPYLGFGIGASFNSYSRGDWMKEAEKYLEEISGRDFDVNADFDNSFAFKIPIGADIFITKNIAFNVEAKYFYSKPKAEFNIESDLLGISTDGVGEIDQSTFAFGIGPTFYF